MKTQTELQEMTVKAIRAYASEEGVTLPSRARKAELIEGLLALLSSKEIAEPKEETPEPAPAPEEPAPAVTNPAHSAEGRKLLKATRRDLMPYARTLGAVRPSAMSKGALIAFILENQEPAPTSPPAEKSPATKAPKPKAAPKKALKKEPKGWGFSSREGGHGDASKRLIRAKSVEEKAEIAAELMEATGWTVATPTAPLIVEAQYGDASIAIEYPEDGTELIPGHPKSPLIRLWKSSKHKGAKLPNVSAAVRAANALMEKLAKATADKGTPEQAEPKAARNADPLAA